MQIKKLRLIHGLAVFTLPFDHPTGVQFRHYLKVCLFYIEQRDAPQTHNHTRGKALKENTIYERVLPAEEGRTH